MSVCHKMCVSDINVIKKTVLICADPYDEQCPSYQRCDNSLTGYCKHYEVSNGGHHECKLSWGFTEAQINSMG